jgi:hypothetical protein
LAAASAVVHLVTGVVVDRYWWLRGLRVSGLQMVNVVGVAAAAAAAVVAEQQQQWWTLSVWQQLLWQQTAGCLATACWMMLLELG